jgi:hypothetical protein
MINCLTYARGFCTTNFPCFHGFETDGFICDHGFSTNSFSNVMDFKLLQIFNKLQNFNTKFVYIIFGGIMASDVNFKQIKIENRCPFENLILQL